MASTADDYAFDLAMEARDARLEEELVEAVTDMFVGREPLQDPQALLQEMTIPPRIGYVLVRVAQEELRRQAVVQEGRNAGTNTTRQKARRRRTKILALVEEHGDLPDEVIREAWIEKYGTETAPSLTTIWRHRKQ